MRKIWHAGAGTLAAVLLLTGLTYGITMRQLSETAAILDHAPVTIVLDPGHGGEDGGALSCTGVPESQINLAIGQKLNQLLLFCGYRTFPIRTEDVSVYTGECKTISEKKVSDLKHRVALTNAIRPAILISIHQNHFSDPQYRGAQVFYAGDADSKALAERTQMVLRRVLDPRNRREPKRSESVYLMEHIECPGILVECGFLSHPQEEQLLQEPRYQKKIACAIAEALTQYLQERKPYGEV